MYIEYWGLDDIDYLRRKEAKLEIYQKNGFKLLELTNEDLFNLNHAIERKLLDFGVKIG